jgi:hypothetical protein
MAENNAGSAVAGFLALLFFVALASECDNSTGYVSSAGPGGGREDHPLEVAVDEYEAARQKLAEVAFDEERKGRYIKEVDAELERMDYDFNGISYWEKKSRNRFRSTLIEACRARGIAPPEYLSQIGAPFDKTEASVDWGGYFSNSSKLSDSVRQWIATQGATVDTRREEVARLKVKQEVPSKILALKSLRTELEGKLHNAQERLRKFESDIDHLEQSVWNEPTEKHLGREMLRSKREHVDYLRTFIDGLKRATADLQFMETKSRDQFAMQEFGVDESRRLIARIDFTLTKYRGSAFEPKPEAAIDGRPEESQMAETQ